MERKDFIDKWGWDPGDSRKELSADLDSLSLPPAEGAEEYLKLPQNDGKLKYCPAHFFPTLIQLMEGFAAQPQPTAEGAEAKTGEWKLVGHSSQIADTGDYDGYYEITNGKMSIYTQDDDDEALQPVVDALNDSGCKFYLDDALACDNYILRHDIAELEEELARIQQQPTAEGAEQPSNEKQYPYCPTCGDTIEHNEDYGGYCCTKCRDGHNNEFPAQPQPTDEGAEEITAEEFIREKIRQKYGLSNEEMTGSLGLRCTCIGRDASRWAKEFATLHAQKIADKMVSERLRDELALYHRWIQKNKYTNIIHSHHECAAEYLKSRDSHD